MEENLKENVKDDEIDLNEIYLILKRQRFIILIIMLVFLIGGTAYAFLSKPVYKYTYDLKLPSSKKNLLISPDLLKIYLNNIKSNKNVSIKANKADNSIIGVSVESSDRNKIKPISMSVYNYLNDMPLLKQKISGIKASLAMRIKYMRSNIYRDNLMFNILRSDIIKGNVKIVGFNPIQMGNSLLNLKMRYAYYKNTLNGFKGGAIKIISMPPIPTRPVKPKKPLIIAVSLISGLFIGIFAAFFVEWRKKNSASGQ
ncbi:MAG: Wzz/FepE/Etk N-terminal domain-containing protein [Burkholderiales bacterium]